MLRRLLLFAAFTTVVSAAPMSYTVTGTGTGYWNSQPFTNATFTFIFNSDTSTIVNGTSCCTSTDSTPSGTAASVTVTGFSPALLTGDQAIFMNHATDTAGIWHFNSPEYVTVANSVFATDNLTTPIEAYSVTGTWFSYDTPMPLSTGGTLYFTSVNNVYYWQQPGNQGAQPSATSVTPSSGTMNVDTAQTFSLVVSDPAGASDIGGVDFQLRDKPTYPNACWLYYNAASKTLAVNHHSEWGPPTPIGSSGSTLTGDACTVDTTAVTVSSSGNNLTLNVPVYATIADNNQWQIFVDVQNKENLDAGYMQLGTVTVQSPQGAQGFTLSVAPSQPQYAPTATAVNYTVTAAATGGFNQPITFTGTSTPRQSSNTTQLSFAFNPTTLSGSGSTTMTVTSPSSATPDYYTLTITGTSQSVTESQTVTLRLDNGPPVITLSPTSGTGATQSFTLTWNDTTQVSTLNVLFAPSQDGRNACWIYFDVAGQGPDGLPHELYLASDDGSSWIDAGSAGFAPFGGQGAGASNSQCTIGGPNSDYDDDNGIGNGYHSGYNSLVIPVTFTPAFAGTKTTYVNGANQAGFVSGYQPVGGWTAP